MLVKKDPLYIIDKYLKTLRDLINSKVIKYQAPTKRYKNFTDYIKHKLGLDKREDWDFLCACMDIVGDTNLAIENFVRFEVDGPTKYNNIGEKYLRLYGFLNATFLQQNSIITLCNVFKIPNLTTRKNKVFDLKIREIRNKLASHSNNCNGKPIFLTRISLHKTKVEYGIGSRGKYEATDLAVLLNEHIEIMIKMLDLILEKVIGYIYKKNVRLKSKYSELLDDLREEKKGNIVIKLSGSKKIRVVMRELETP